MWDKDVRFFKVHDAETGEHIASFYLDPYSRPENKRVRDQGDMPWRRCDDGFTHAGLF